MNFDSLKEKHRQRRDQQEQSLSIRIHRALSWLNKAEQESDTDAKFIFLWVCFNAAYAKDMDQYDSERNRFHDFIKTLVSLDKSGKIQQLLFDEFSGVIRVLISNKYIFEPFWKALREHDSSDRWKDSFEKAKTLATKALFKKDTATVLEIIFDRLYVLRNQLIHGGATWQSDLNRQQVRDGARMLEHLIPTILALMLEEDELDMGEIMFPVV